MDGAKGSALEWALALLHAPGKRHALRQKSLPDGMDVLLGIAAGAMPDALAGAARTFGEPEARIREAAQFYVREVLFFPQADAYRVLGVRVDASDTSIKAHHRLLQHWLHPDRLHNEDDAIFATRVNVAWNRLRNPERRQAYDASLGQEESEQAVEGIQAMGTARTWIPDAELSGHPWWHRLPMLALSVACILLAVLVLRDMDRGGQRWDGASPEDPAEASVGAGMEIHVPRVAASASPVAAAGKVSGSVAATPVEAAALRPAAVTVPRAAPAVDAPLQAWRAVSEVDSIPRLDVPPARTPGPVLRTLALPDATATTASNEEEAPPTAAPPEDSARPARAKPPVGQAEALPSYARIRQAWSAGDQLLRFMGGIGRPPPPIWSSPGIQTSADLLRQDMHGAGRVRLSGSQWQIGEKSAVLTSDYVVQGESPGAGNGRLTADLVWRDSRWLVVGLSIERSQ